MAANSKHFRDILVWVYKVMDSCTTVSQTLSAQRLARLYTKKYPSKEFGDEGYITSEILRDLGYEKLNQVLENDQTN